MGRCDRLGEHRPQSALPAPLQPANYLGAWVQSLEEEPVARKMRKNWKRYDGLTLRPQLAPVLLRF